MPRHKFNRQDVVKGMASRAKRREARQGVSATALMIAALVRDLQGRRGRAISNADMMAVLRGGLTGSTLSAIMGKLVNAGYLRRVGARAKFEATDKRVDETLLSRLMKTRLANLRLRIDGDDLDTSGLDAALVSENDGLRRALAPFAAAAGRMNDLDGSHTPILLRSDRVTVDDFRAAAKTLGMQYEDSEDGNADADFVSYLQG